MVMHASFSIALLESVVVRTSPLFFLIMESRALWERMEGKLKKNREVEKELS